MKMEDNYSNNKTTKKQKKKKKGSCYQCGQLDHRAKDCPNVTPDVRNIIRARREAASTVIDYGQFAATSAKASASSSSSPGQFTYIELFAGMGGFRVALDKLGGRCVFASEIDRFCITNYQLNFGGDRPASGDICNIPSNAIPHHDILVGGFPCQPFSNSGKCEGMQDTKRRGVLYREITRILKCRQPRCFLLENVRGLLLHDDGRTFDVIRKEFEDCGYHVQYELINAVNLLPQERNRLYIVGIRNDLVESGCRYAFPTLPNLRRGVKDIIMQQQQELSKEEIVKLTLTAHQLSKVRQQTYTQKFPEARFLCDLSLPAKTIQSSYSSYMVGSQFVPVLDNDDDNDTMESTKKISHDDESIAWRRFSQREASRIQGFPETFHLCSQRAYHMIGNAVAPPVVVMIAAPLLVRVIGLTMNNNDHDLGWKVARELLIEASPNDSRRIELIVTKLNNI